MMGAITHAVAAVVMVAIYSMAPGLAAFTGFVVAFWWWREAEQARRTYQKWVMPWEWSWHRISEAAAPSAAAIIVALIAARLT